MKYVVTGFYWGKIILITVVLLLSYANLFFFFVLDQEYFTLILLVYPAFSHDSNRNVQFYIEKLYLSDYVGNRGNCVIVTCKITWLQKGVGFFKKYQNLSFLKNIRLQIISKLNEKSRMIFDNYRASSGSEETHTYSRHRNKRFWLLLTKPYCLVAYQKRELDE